MSTMLQCGIWGLGLVLGLSATAGRSVDATLKIVSIEFDGKPVAKVPPKDKKGGETAAVKLKIKVKNITEGIVGISPRTFKYTLTHKKTGNKFAQFMHRDPDMKDARPLESGKEAVLDADLVGFSGIVKVGEPYVLTVEGHGDSATKELTFEKKEK